MSIQNITPYKLFEILNEDEISRLVKISSFKSYKKNTLILKKHSQIKDMYFINEGIVRVEKNVGSKKDDFDILYKAGDYFGEVNFFNEKPYFFNTIAVEDTQVLVFDYQHLRAIILLHKKLGNKILWCICRNLSSQLRMTNNRMKEIFNVNLDSDKTTFSTGHTIDLKIESLIK